jgi:hypothetical protein
MRKVALYIVVIGLVIGGLLLPAWVGSAHAAAAISDYDISGYINPQTDGLSPVYFVGSYNDYSGNPGYFFQNLGTFEGGQTTPFSFTTSYVGYAPATYTILAIHDMANDGVTVGSNTIVLGTSWDSLGTHYTQGTFSSQLVGSFIGGFLEQFYAENPNILGAPMGVSLRLVNFSDASNGGSAYASTVPLPASALLFAPCLAGLAAIRRRRGK